MLWLQGVKLLHSYRVLSPTLINRHFVTLNESQYNALAEKSLECLVDSLEACQNRATNTKEDIEVSLSQGVLKFELGPKTWVINKQTPNRQLWWSSPISGPLRFEYALTSTEQLSIPNTLTAAEKYQILRNWKCTRNGPDLFTRLRSEVLLSAQLDIEEL